MTCFFFLLKSIILPVVRVTFYLYNFIFYFCNKQNNLGQLNQKYLKCMFTYFVKLLKFLLGWVGLFVYLFYFFVFAC